MRVAITNDLYKPGGAVGLLADRFVRALLEAGHDATLICGVNDQYGPPPSDIPHIVWDYPARSGGFIKSLGFFRKLRRNSAVAFRKWSETGKPDAWMSMVPPSGYGAWQAGGNQIPFLYMANSPWAQEWLVAYRQRKGKEAPGISKVLGVWPRRRIERKLVRDASALLALSPTQLLWMVNEHGDCSKAKKHIIEAGVDCAEVLSPSEAQRVEWREDLCRECGVEKGASILICSRRLVPRTGVSVLIAAFAGLPRETHLVITGDGEERESLQREAETYDLAKRVSFTGIIPFDQLMRFTAASDFAILPTQELEGFGLSAAEAFACGTPVMATPVGALSDVVGGLDEALISDGIDSDSIRTKLQALLADSDWKGQEAHQKARLYAESRFDWQKHKAAFVAAMEAVALSKRQR